MTRRNRNRTLDTLAHRLDRAADIVPDVFGALDDQRRHTNAIRAAVGGSGSSDISDPVGRTVVALDGIEYHRRTITDAIATLGVCIDMLDEACRRALGYREPGVEQMPTCAEIVIVDDTERTCGRYVEYMTRDDGSTYFRDKCARCRKAEQRAKRGEDAA